MTAIESKEEISDTDSGIIVHSPDSPTSPLKEGMTHTRALKLKHQALEERLELCLLELRKLCIREAELTGKLPSDYPLMPEEKPPRVRRRIGASFKLDEDLIDSELHALETELALQRQIYEAARKLSLEDNLSKPQKKSRAQQCKREEKKVKELQEAVFQHRVKSECNSPKITSSNQHKLNMSDDSSLSDVVALDEVDSPCPLSPPATGHPFTDPLHLPPKPLLSCPVSSSLSSVDSERTPIQSSPWRESSLDHPIKKNTSPAHVSSDSTRALPSPFTKSSSLRYNHSTSAPSTPELHVRRQYSQSFLPKSKPLSVDSNKGRGRLPQRRPEFILCSPQYSPLRLSQSSSEDTSSEHSSSSYISSPGRDGPTEIPKLCPPPYGFHYGSGNLVLQRAADGTPLQWFVAQDSEIISQV
uniref:Cytohesin Ubiquitin Protein Inducing domain-containing protein n=1 Tax=Periophthalmus magnuspinnatus TaxID=409849 RepID=A0A3B4AAF8_9GOBI